MNHFNLLPPETIEFIFEKLNFNDLINLRIVDKRFKQICEQIKIKQLIVCDKLNNHSLFWIYENGPTYFNKNNSIEFSKFKDYVTIFQLDKCLKRLALDIRIFDFSILNEFKLLEQLRVTTNFLINDYKLSLDNLKIADFHFKSNHRCNSRFKLTFDTIRLFAFRFVNKNNKRDFVFNYSDKILFFEIDYKIDDYSLFEYYLKNFNNLQYLKINYLNDGFIQRNILSQFKNLKIIDLFIEYGHRGGLNNLVKDIKFLINEKANLKRLELEIYFNGVKLIDQNKIYELKWLYASLYSIKFDYDLLEFQIKNYDLLKDNCKRYEINYCDLIKLIKIIPSSFTNKFPFIHRVEAIGHIDNENQFIKFLNSLPYLFKLKLINCELTESFYDQLMNSVYSNNLEHLRIEENKDLEMNFDFILKLKKLENFRTNQIITDYIDLIYKFFTGNKNNLSFTFKCDSEKFIEIYKLNGLFYIESYLYNYFRKVDKFSIENLKNLDNVISKLKELKF